MNSKKIIIGLGTGRCGTLSLSHLLNIQPNADVTHERKPILPWKFDRTLIQQKIESLLDSDRAIVGDVALYYLPYVPFIANTYKNVYFICLKRDKTETIESYFNWLKGNPWSKEYDQSDENTYFFDSYPKYDISEKKSAISQYWDEYYKLAQEYEKKYSFFRVFNTQNLNTQRGVTSILEFLEIQGSIIETSIKLHTKKNFTLQNFFQKDILIKPGEVLAFCKAFNEMHRLPFFLEYYRSCGVDRFFIIDNNSTDGTRDYLATQPDVVYWFTEDSFRTAANGRLWLNDLLNTYGKGHWCLTVDIDELLVYPWIEHFNLPQLCRYLDERKYEGLYTFLLDMYSQDSIQSVQYQTGTSFLKSCSYFDAHPYKVNIRQAFPKISVSGGVRQRVFFENGNIPRSPTLVKIPLVKWRDNLEYLSSTHSITPIQLADITGVLLHFKFFNTFMSYVTREIRRGQMSGKHYVLDRYQTVLQEQPHLSLFEPTISQAYENSMQLVTLGIVRMTSQYMRFFDLTLRVKLKNKLFAKVRSETKDSILSAQRNYAPSWGNALMLWDTLVVVNNESE
jgi:hypothetical protein